MADRLAWVALAGLLVACGGASELGANHGEARAPLACPRDAVASNGACRCASGLSVLDGACVGPRELEAYCGAPALGTGECASPGCGPGDALDPATLGCSPPSVARGLVARARPVPDDLALGCHEGGVLAVHGDYVGCLLAANICPLGAAWEPKAARCVPLPRCAAGEVRGQGGVCVRVLAWSRERGTPLVDVGRWSNAMLAGDDSGGASRLCRSLAREPWELDVGPGGARTLVLQVELVFPDNDVTQVSGRAELSEGASASPRGAEARSVQRALEALLVPLRALGGSSDAASATTSLRCTVRGGASPFLFPRSSPGSP